jgi:hypothetical protein
MTIAPHCSPNPALAISAAARMAVLVGVLLQAKSEASDNPACQSAPPLDSAVVLSPVDISAKPFGCFGISIRAERDALTSRVSEMTVLDVIPNSEADRDGLAPFTRILRIDGREVGEFIASFNRGSELNAKLINRKKGDRIVLEVLALGSRKSKVVTLTEGSATRYFPRDSDSEYEPPGAMHFPVTH